MKHIASPSRVGIGPVILGVLAMAVSGVRGSDLVLVWNDLALRAVRYGNAPPPMAVRQMAVVHLAVFDALNGIERKYTAYLVEPEAPGECSKEAAVSAAAHHTLRTLFPKSADTLDSHLVAVLAAIPNTTAKTNGVAWGNRVASELLKARQFDGAGQAAGYDYRQLAGYWERTPPNYDKPLLPGSANCSCLRPPGKPMSDSIEVFTATPLVSIASLRCGCARRGLRGSDFVLFLFSCPHFSA